MVHPINLFTKLVSHSLKRSRGFLAPYSLKTLRGPGTFPAMGNVTGLGEGVTEPRSLEDILLSGC